MNNEEKILSMLETLTVDMAVVKADVTDLKQGQARLESELAEVKTDVTGIKSELADTKRHVILIENDLKLTRGALLDGYKQTYDILNDEIRPDIAALKANSEIRDLRVLRLESERKSS